MQHPDTTHKLARAAFIASTALVLIAAAFWGTRLYILHRNQGQLVGQAQAQAQGANAPIWGFPMPGKLAPDFKLTDQFGHTVSLSSLRGHEVVMAFIDPRCTSICPLTAQVMYDAKARLTTDAAKQVTLIAINSNPAATGINELQAWSIKHGLLHQWLFLTGSPKELEAVYHSYNVLVQVNSAGESEHDPATFIIDAQGHSRLYYETLDSKSSIDLTNQELGLAAGMKQWLPPSK